MTKKETKEVKKILSNVDREFLVAFLDKINLSNRERSVINFTELNRETISEVAEKMYISVDSVSHIKKSAIKKIYLYSMQKNYIKNTK